MVMSASSFSGFPADARILGLDIGSISVDVVLLDGLGTPLYSRYVRHHGQPDKVLCAELEALERTHAGIAAAVTGTGADRVGRLLGACAVNEVIAQVAAASFRCPQARSVIDIGTLNIIIQRNDIASFLPDLYRTFGELSAEMHSPEPSVDKVLELDSRFHTQIANAAQNPMLATITEYITRLTLPSRLETTRKVLAKGEAEIERFVELHRQLLSVIERRQVDEIAATVQDHYIFWKK